MQLRGAAFRHGIHVLTRGANAQLLNVLVDFSFTTDEKFVSVGKQLSAGWVLGKFPALVLIRRGVSLHVSCSVLI